MLWCEVELRADHGGMIVAGMIWLEYDEVLWRGEGGAL